MHGPSAHLTWNELACWDRGRMPWRLLSAYPQNWRASRAVVLAHAFEAIRTACNNRPLIVLSAYRTAEYNVRIGGAKNSQHVQGRALDLAPPNGLTVDQFAQVVLSVAHHDGSKIKGIGIYDTFVHVDVRPAARLARWDERSLT